MCPPHKDMVPHPADWEILSIEGMVFIACSILVGFVILFGSCQVWYYVHKKDALGLDTPVSAESHDYHTWANLQCHY